MRPITATFLACVLMASAQQPAQPPAAPAPAPAKTGYKFEASTQLVVEDLILKDKSGKPITGLKTSDFVVSEDGKPQKVEFVEFQNLEETAVPLPEPAAAPKTLEKRAEPPAAKPVTANQIAPEKPGDIKYKDRRLMVMFFDMTSMPLADQFRAQTAAEKFLKTQ